VYIVIEAEIEEGARKRLTTRLVLEDGESAPGHIVDLQTLMRAAIASLPRGIDRVLTAKMPSARSKRGRE
jgi:myo-inositol-1-phosphate synthase